MNNLYLVLWVMHQDHVSRLSARVCPFPALSAQLCIPVAFRLAAFASWSFPSPLKSSAFLAVGLLRVSTISETSLGLSCSACVRYNRGGCLLYCGSWVSFPVIRKPTGTIAPFIIVSAVPMTATSRSLIKGSFTFILPVFSLPGCLIRLEASLDVTPRFPPHRCQ